MSIIVTGAAGFIGANNVLALNKQIHGSYSINRKCTTELPTFNGNF